MKEIKSTIVGIVLVVIGVFFIWSDRVDIQSNNYLMYGCFGLIIFGVYLILTTNLTRKNHLKILVSFLRDKFGRK